MHMHIFELLFKAANLYYRYDGPMVKKVTTDLDMMEIMMFHYGLLMIKY